MSNLAHPAYGLHLCSNGRQGHESVFMIRTVKKSTAQNAQQQFEIPLHIRIVAADAESVGRAVIELLELKPKSGTRSGETYSALLPDIKKARLTGLFYVW